MDWKPNLEGVSWFLEKIWPHISKEHFELTIAGKGIENWAKASKSLSDVKLIGMYKSVTHLFESHDLLLIPLFSGAGIRIKVLEAMQYGIPFVGTKIALDGIHGIEDLEVAPKVNLWIEKINAIYENHVNLNSISEKNKKTYNSNYSNEIIKQQWQNVF
jgi:glycosyltransferase involved in cell wall biosynthesis